MSNVQQSIVDEQTVLLSDRNDSECQRTPLPKLQLAIVLLLQSCEIVMGTSIMPYINQVRLVHLRHDRITPSYFHLFQSLSKIWVSLEVIAQK